MDSSFRRPFYMLNLFRHLSFCLLCSTVTIAPYTLAGSINQVSIAINNQKPQTTESLLTKGLTTVLVRLTGNPNITEQKSLEDVLKKPNDYLENYSQQSQPDRLEATFDQQAIKQALDKAGIAYWANRRPIIMTWWLNETNSDNSLVGDSQPSSETITDAANTQNFPLRFPLADLNEQALASKTYFDAKTPKEILEASEQYATNAILVVHSQQTEKGYHATWRLWLADNESKPLTQGTSDASSEKEIAEQIFAAINPELAKIFVIKDTTAESLEIVVKDVDFGRYVQVNSLMDSFKGKVLETSGSTVRYQVQASPAQIKAQLGLLHFVEEKTDNPTTSQTSTLTFKAQ